MRCIYVIQSDAGPVKVGIARRPAHRLQQLRTSSAVPLSLGFAAETAADVVSLERRAHELLQPHRLNGEWFSVKVDSAVGAVIQAAAELGADLALPSPVVTTLQRREVGVMLYSTASSFLMSFGSAVPPRSRDLLVMFGETSGMGGSIPVALDNAGGILVPLRPLMTGMGLNWSGQFQRVKRDPILREGMVVMTVPTIGGARKTTCLPLDLVPGFLFGVDASRVAHAVRPKIIAYQRECHRRLAA